MSPQVTGPQIATAARHLVDLPAGRSRHFDPGPHAVPVAAGTDQVQQNPVPPAPDLVHEQMGPPAAVVDQDIQIAVVVQVSKAGTAADPRLQSRFPGEARVFAELALPVLQQHVGLGVTKAELNLLDVVQDVSVDHQQILIPVIVKIQEPGAEPQQELISPGDSGGGPFIGEQPVLVVAVEGVGLHIVIGHHDIHQAVPVVVGRIGAHSRFRVGLLVVAGSRKQGHVFETTLAVVPVVEIPFRVVGDVEVHPAVIVEIGSHHPQALALRVEDAGGGRHVPKATAAQVLV